MQAAYGCDVHWLVVGEYAISPVDHVCYPNRALRGSELLSVRDADDGEHLDIPGSRAWALADHQFSHIFIRDGDQSTIAEVAAIFRDHPGIAEVLVGRELRQYCLDHERSGEVVLVSDPNSWQAYYWWLEDSAAPGFARTVDIHRKPGYDPVELFFDPRTRGIPLDASLIKGSHGAPAVDATQRALIVSSRQGTIVSSRQGTLGANRVRDIDVHRLVLERFER
jgi:hypothetical protein